MLCAHKKPWKAQQTQAHTQTHTITMCHRHILSLLSPMLQPMGVKEGEREDGEQRVARQSGVTQYGLSKSGVHGWNIWQKSPQSVSWWWVFIVKYATH